MRWSEVPLVCFSPLSLISWAAGSLPRSGAGPRRFKKGWLHLNQSFCFFGRSELLVLVSVQNSDKVPAKHLETTEQGSSFSGDIFRSFLIFGMTFRFGSKDISGQFRSAGVPP